MVSFSVLMYISHSVFMDHTAYPVFILIDHIGMPSLKKCPSRSSAYFFNKVVFLLLRTCREAGSMPGSGRFPGGGHGNPLQDSCLENRMDRGAW